MARKRTPKTQLKRARELWALHLIASYARAKQADDDEDAMKLAIAIRELPFSGVLAYILSIAEGPASNRLRPDCLAALNRHPEIKTWL